MEIYSMWVRLFLISFFWTPLVQAAEIDVTSCVHNHIVKLPAGSYHLSQFILPEGCSLVGAGIQETFLECSVTDAGRCLTIPASSREVRLADFTLLARGEERIQTGSARYVRGIGILPGSADIKIEQVRVVDGGQRAIEIFNPQKATVRNVEVIGTSHIPGKEGDGIHIDGWATKQAGPCTHVAILDSYVESPGDTAISACYCSHVEIARNRIFGASYFNVPATIEESGIDLTGAQDARVHDNQIWRIARYCGYASSYTDEKGEWRIPQDIWFERNFCSQFVERDEQLPGFYIVGKMNIPRQYATGIYFLDNHFIGFRGTAILLTAAIRRFRIQGNDLESANGIPISIGSSLGKDVADGSLQGNNLNNGEIKIQSDAINILH